MPESLNPFFVVIMAYTMSTVTFAVLYFATDSGDSFDSADGQAQLDVICIGFSIVFIEFGLIKLYRAGWDISVGSLTSNIIVAVFLIFVGIVFCKEKISIRQRIGIMICIAGLFFINKR